MSQQTGSGGPMLNLPYAYFYQGNMMPGSFQYGTPALYPVSLSFFFYSICHLKSIMNNHFSSCSNKWPPQTHHLVLSSQSHRTIVATVPLAMTHWANPLRIIIKAAMPAQVANNRKDKMFRIHRRVAPVPTSHRPCMARAMLHWTKWTWVS